MNYYFSTFAQFPFFYFIPQQLLAQNSQMGLIPQMKKEQKQIEIKQKQEFGQSSLISVTQADLEQKGYEKNKRSWTEKEDKLLLQLCKDQNLRFQEIAERIPDRNAKMCYSRYRRLANKVKESWTEQEDESLGRLVVQKKFDWKQISLFFKKRTDKQLKEHYLNYLRPDLNKSEWCLQEDLKLIELVNKHGHDWQKIEVKMSDRSRNQIKNRFFGRIKRINDQKKKKSQIQT